MVVVRMMISPVSLIFMLYYRPKDHTDLIAVKDMHAFKTVSMKYKWNCIKRNLWTFKIEDILKKLQKSSIEGLGTVLPKSDLSIVTLVFSLLLLES